MGVLFSLFHYFLVFWVAAEVYVAVREVDEQSSTVRKPEQGENYLWKNGIYLHLSEQNSSNDLIRRFYEVLKDTII